MARLQILQLPEGADDKRPPFVLVVDEASEETAQSLAPVGVSTAELVGARTVLVFQETVEIPANAPSRMAREAEGPDCADVPDCDGRCCDIRNADEELRHAEVAAKRLTVALAEARQWARHGYEIGQRHCSWTDHGVAPAWLTEGWPPHFDSCEHLQRAGAYDEALTRVRGLPEEPAFMNALHEEPSGYRHGYRVAIGDAKRAARVEQPQATGGEKSAGRPTHPDGAPYNYSEITAGGWEHCDGCKSWGQWTPQSPHDCPAPLRVQASGASPTPGG